MEDAQRLWRDYNATVAGQTKEWHEITVTDGRVVATLVQDPHADPDAPEWTPEQVRAHATLLAAAPDMKALLQRWFRDASIMDKTTAVLCKETAILLDSLDSPK